MDEVIDTIKCLTEIDGIVKYLKLENVDILSVIKHAKEKEENKVLIPLLLKASKKIRELNKETRNNLNSDDEKLVNVQKALDNLSISNRNNYINFGAFEPSINARIYVLSDPLNESVGRYKVGSHTGSLQKLISRYITPMPELKIHCFVETPMALDIEAMFKIMFPERRVVNINGHKSEWYLIPLQDIIETLNYLLSVDLNIKSDNSVNCNCFTKEHQFISALNNRQYLLCVNDKNKFKTIIKGEHSYYLIRKQEFYEFYLTYCGTFNITKPKKEPFWQIIKEYKLVKEHTDRRNGDYVRYYMIPNNWIQQ